MKKSWQWAKQYIGLQEGKRPCKECGELTSFRSVGLDSDCCTWPGCKRAFTHTATRDHVPNCGEKDVNLRVVVAGYCDRHWEERNKHSSNCACLPTDVRTAEHGREMLFLAEKAQLDLNPSLH